MRTLRPAIWTQAGQEIPHSEINALVQELSAVEFAPVKKLARKLRRAPTTAHRHLTESLHFVSKHLQLAPHTLAVAQKVSHDMTTAYKVLRSRNQMSFIDSSSPCDTMIQPC
jgi:hypothetical protein